MQPELALLAAACGLLVLLLCPWWTEDRARRRLLGTRSARRGRHRFELPAPDPRRLWVGSRHPFGRAVGQAPDAEGRNGWLGRLDLWGNVWVERWLDPPAS